AVAAGAGGASAGAGSPVGDAASAPRILSPEFRLAPAAPTVVLITGTNGAGKTTSIAKLAHMFRRQNKTVLLAACDTFRAGAVRQLEVWAERLGVEVVKGQQGGDPAAVAFDACKAAVARGVDVLILDTAGRLHTQDPLMRQLGKIYNVAGKLIPGAPHEALLVLDATTGQNAVRQAQEFARFSPLSGLILTKLDGTAKGGVVIAIRQATSIPVKFIGTGETPDDLQPFNADEFAEAMFSEEA
ncbi:MAG: signal recognition particle-docking protein FtsY, partial [Phycisphaerales bacterium]